MIITLYQFILLNDIEQAETLWEHGVMISERKEGDIRYILYQIDKFYIEVQYHTEQNVVMKLLPIENTDEWLLT
jgi:hypothetical protein